MLLAINIFNDNHSIFHEHPMDDTFPFPLDKTYHLSRWISCFVVGHFFWFCGTRFILAFWCLAKPIFHHLYSAKKKNGILRWKKQNQANQKMLTITEHCIRAWLSSFSIYLNVTLKCTITDTLWNRRNVKLILNAVFHLSILPWLVDNYS